MFDWSDLRVFLAAHRTGSLSRAAAELGIGISTASRRISTLENDLGKPLFARTPTGLQLTVAGTALVPHAEATERSALAALAAVQSLDEEPEGTVTVALSTDMLLLVLLPRLSEFISAHPKITLCFDQSAQIADLTRLEADIAVRVVRPSRGDELIWTRLREVPMGVFSARQVLERMRDPSDAREHRWIAQYASHPYEQWIQEQGGTVHMRFQNPNSIRHASASGLGTAIMPALFAALTPTLVEAPIPPPPSVQLYMSTHRAVRHSPRVRVVWEVLDRLLRPNPQELVEVRQSVEAAYGIRS